MSAERLNALLGHLPDSQLPADLVQWLQQGFTSWQAGHDLGQALELEPVDLNQRDSMICVVISLSPGNSVAARCSYFLSCLDGCETHRRHDMQRRVERLREMDVPRSLKQLRRILNGRRQDGWKGHKTAVVSLDAAVG